MGGVIECKGAGALGLRVGTVAEVRDVGVRVGLVGRTLGWPGGHWMTYVRRVGGVVVCAPFCVAREGYVIAFFRSVKFVFERLWGFSADGGIVLSVVSLYEGVISMNSAVGPQVRCRSAARFKVWVHVTIKRNNINKRRLRVTVDSGGQR